MNLTNALTAPQQTMSMRRCACTHAHAWRPAPFLTSPVRVCVRCVVTTPGRAPAVRACRILYAQWHRGHLYAVVPSAYAAGRLRLRDAHSMCYTNTLSLTPD